MKLKQYQPVRFGDIELGYIEGVFLRDNGWSIMAYVDRDHPDVEGHEFRRYHQNAFRLLSYMCVVECACLPGWRDEI